MSDLDRQATGAPEPPEREEPEDIEDEGPIELPPGARCALCAYSFTVDVEMPGRIAGSTIKEPKRFCRRMPPSVIVLPTGPQSVGVVAQHPPVLDEGVCFEFDAMPLNLLSANG